ncbi:MAG: class I SAM-dependent methyltransferase, partial [Phycisphaerae bacterium]
MVCVDRLELREQTTGDRRAGARAGGRPILVDFIGGSTGYRRHARLSRRQPIALAMGRRHGPLQVVDATAGLGRDAFLLACMGLSVHMVERNAVLAALLGDGLRRAQAATDPNLAAIIKR